MEVIKYPTDPRALFVSDVFLDLTRNAMGKNVE